MISISGLMILTKLVMTDMLASTLGTVNNQSLWYTHTRILPYQQWIRQRPSNCILSCPQKQFGTHNVGAMIEDNAKTQTGQFKGLVKMNSKLFNKQMFVVGCYPHVLNITVRRCCQAAFGSNGDMSNPHIQQLHYKIALLHH